MTTSPTFEVPGIYLEQNFPKPIPALPTGVPVFLDYVYHPPEQLKPHPHNANLYGPYRLTQWPEFQNYDSNFGDPGLTEALAGAVHGFFANGGLICYIVIMVANSHDPLQAVLAPLLEATDDVADIDLVCMPALVSCGDACTPTELATIQRSQQFILDYCDRTNDRFAILDLPRLAGNDAIDRMQAHLKQLRGRNGALYGPWIKPEQGVVPWVPPCGHVAGIFAQCDQQTGVHRAPANVALVDALDLSLPITQANQQQLNPPEKWAGVNCLRSFTGRGIRIWGARTLSNQPNDCYVNVRRLMITVGRWATRLLADIAFEPNDLSLWIRIERELTVYLESLARLGALQGGTPAEAFFVNCNAETNPPDVRDLGQVITEIGLAPTVPSEFIVIRLIHGETGVTVTNTP